MKWKNRDMREEPPKQALVGSVLVHGVVLVVAVVLSIARPEPMPLETFQVEIVSAPPIQSEEAQEEAPTEELVVETPDEPEPVQEETPTPIPDPEPEQTPPEPEAEETPPDLPPDSTEVEATTTEEVETTAEESGEDINVRMEGLRRDFPVYYRNIITQVGRCWSRLQPRDSRDGLEVTVYFVIGADGKVVGRPEVVERSGSARFDGLAVEAIGGCASGRFGELPRDLGYERLPIQFTLSPGGEGAPGTDLPSDDDA